MTETGRVPRALVADDSAEYRRLIANALHGAGFFVRETGDGEGTLLECAHTPPDVIVLDVGLPDIDGVEVCRRLRRFCDAYVIMLTARDQEIDVLIGLAAGADDYIAKPSSGRQIAARAHAMLRRPRSMSDERMAVRVHGGLVIDVMAREVTLDGRPIALTRIEFEILEALSRNPRAVMERVTLLDEVWGESWPPDDHALDVHVLNLRRKLGRDRIATVRGVGYRLNGAGVPIAR